MGDGFNSSRLGLSLFYAGTKSLDRRRLLRIRQTTNERTRNNTTMIANQKLTTSFSLYDLTRTDRADFQERNRQVTPDQITKLTELARLLEHVVFVLGTNLTVHSAYRCPDLNAAVGSTPKSQHLLCEAADFVPGTQDLGIAFRTIWKDIKDTGTNVGQLIHEKAQRSYGTTEWIHISLGVPYRPLEKCKQILRLENGVYTRLA